MSQKFKAFLILIVLAGVSAKSLYGTTPERTEVEKLNILDAIEGTPEGNVPVTFKDIGDLLYILEDRLSESRKEPETQPPMVENQLSAAQELLSSGNEIKRIKRLPFLDVNEELPVAEPLTSNEEITISNAAKTEEIATTENTKESVTEQAEDVTTKVAFVQPSDLNDDQKIISTTEVGNINDSKLKDEKDDLVSAHDFSETQKEEGRAEDKIQKAEETKEEDTSDDQVPKSLPLKSNLEGDSKSKDLGGSLTGDSSIHEKRSLVPQSSTTIEGSKLIGGEDDDGADDNKAKLNLKTKNKNGSSIIEAKTLLIPLKAQNSASKRQQPPADPGVSPAPPGGDPSPSPSDSPIPADRPGDGPKPDSPDTPKPGDDDSFALKFNPNLILIILNFLICLKFI